MSKAKALREMSDEQLSAELTQVQNDFFRLRIQAATEKLDAPSNLKKLRRQIARLKTLQHERSLTAQK